MTDRDDFGSAGSKEPKRSIVELFLDTNLESFRPRELSFFDGLASVLNLDPEEMRIVRVRIGCVKVMLDIPEVSAEELRKALSSDPIPDEVRAFFEKFHADPRKTIFHVSAEAPYVKTVNQIDGELSKAGRALTWLHLSDIHLRSDSSAEAWVQDQVKSSFIENLPGLLAKWNLKPNAIFFTGDVAFSGEEQQYDVAKSFFTSLMGKLEPKPKLYIVPGNHDVTWSKIRKGDKKLSERLSNPLAVAKYWFDESQKVERDADFRRFEHYFNFIQDCAAKFNHPILNEGYFYTDQFQHSGVNVGVAGLNSAWRSTRKDGSKKSPKGYDSDKDSLILGEPQLVRSIQELQTSQVRFALLHHPPNSMWFKDFDRAMQSAKLPDFDFVLRGHEHESAASNTTNIYNESDILQIASGALYDSSEYKGESGYPISFKAVRINLDSGKGIIFDWRYFPKHYKWARDITADDGFTLFDVPAKIMKRLPPSPDSIRKRAHN